MGFVVAGQLKQKCNFLLYLLVRMQELDEIIIF